MPETERSEWKWAGKLNLQVTRNYELLFWIEYGGYSVCAWIHQGRTDHNVNSECNTLDWNNCRWIASSHAWTVGNLQRERLIGWLWHFQQLCRQHQQYFAVVKKIYNKLSQYAESQGKFISKCQRKMPILILPCWCPAAAATMQLHD